MTRVAHVGTYNKDSADGTEKTVAGLVTIGSEISPVEIVDGRDKLGRDERKTTRRRQCLRLP